MVRQACSQLLHAARHVLAAMLLASLVWLGQDWEVETSVVFAPEDHLRSRSTLGAREDDVLHLLGPLLAVVNWVDLLPVTFMLS